MKTSEGRPVSVEVIPVDGEFTVSPVWAGVDRPKSGGWRVPNERLAARLKAALLSGKAAPNPRIMIDVNGNTFVSHDHVVRGRCLNADLKRLGF